MDSTRVESRPPIYAGLLPYRQLDHGYGRYGNLPAANLAVPVVAFANQHRDTPPRTGTGMCPRSGVSLSAVREWRPEAASLWLPLQRQSRLRAHSVC